MSSLGDPMSWILSIEPLTGANYPQWREKINMGLAIFEIDKAITDKRPEEPTRLEIPDDLGVDAKAEREKENSKLMGCLRLRKLTGRGQTTSVSWSSRKESQKLQGEQSQIVTLPWST
jgi:hypothetical protein